MDEMILIQAGKKPAEGRWSKVVTVYTDTPLGQYGGKDITYVDVFDFVSNHVRGAPVKASQMLNSIVWTFYNQQRARIEAKAEKVPAKV